MAAPPVAARGGRRSRTGLSESASAYAYIAPAIAAMVVASFIPIAFTVYVSFTNWDQFHPALVEGFHWAGLSNYQEVLSSLQGEFLGVLIWTIMFAAITTAINFFLGLGLAYLLNNPNM